MKQYFESWKPGKSYCEVDGRCEINGSYVRATLNTGRYSIVQIRSEITDVIPDTLYRFDYVLKADKGISHRLLYRFYDKTGAHLYIGNIGRGVIFFAPKDAYKLEVTVFLYSYYGGTADFFGCGIESLKETETRKLKLAAISGVYPGEDHGGVFEHTLEKNVENAARMLDATAAEGADLALLTETYNILYVKGITPYEGSAEFDDPAVRVLADKAKQHHMFVAAGVCFKKAGLIYNAQLIFNPHGELVGLYSKSHTTEGDLANGYVPGNDIPVFDTEIGRLGTSICWDIYFPEHARVMYMKEAEIILHSTESTNPLQLADTAAQIGLTHEQVFRRPGNGARLFDFNGIF